MHIPWGQALSDDINDDDFVALTLLRPEDPGKSMVFHKHTL